MVSKREELRRVTESKNLDELALSETKLKEKGEIMFGGLKGRKSWVYVRIWSIFVI